MALISLDEYYNAQQQPSQNQNPNLRPVVDIPQAPPPQQGQYDTWGDKGAAFMNGMNHGFFMGAPNLAQSQADPEGYQRTVGRNQEHPFSNVGGQIIGGTLGAIAFAPAKAYQALGTAGRVGLSALQGGAQGGVTHANEALAEGNDWGTTAKKGLTGFLGGAIGGATGQGAGEIMGDVAGKMIASRLTPAAGPVNTSAARGASDTIHDTMKAGGLTPQRIEGDIGHLGPQGVLGDHPAMAPAIKQMNRAGGEGPEGFAHFATERVAGAPERRAGDFANPNQNSFGMQMSGRIDGAGKSLDDAVESFGNATLDGRALRNDLAEIARQHASYGDGTMASKVLKFAEGIPDNAVPSHLHNTKKELDTILGWDRTKGPEPGPMMDMRRAIDSHLDGASDLYNAANQNYRSIMLQRDAYDMGLAKGMDDTLAAQLNKQADALNFMPTARQELIDAFKQGAQDRMKSGPMERETTFARTQGLARRDPGAEKDALGIADVMALNAPHGVEAMLGAAGAAATGKGVRSLFAPGEEQGKSLASFLRMSGPERAQALADISNRGGVVKQKTKVYSDRLKAVGRGVGTEIGEKAADVFDPMIGVR